MSRSQPTVWTTAEETAFLKFLLDHKAEAGDGANFKKASFQAAVSHLANFPRHGARKEVKSLQNKWAAVRKMTLISLIK